MSGESCRRRRSGTYQRGCDGLLLLSADQVLQLVSGREKKKAEGIIRPGFDVNFDAGELCPHVDSADDCRQILDETSNEK